MQHTQFATWRTQHLLDLTVNDFSPLTQTPPPLFPLQATASTSQTFRGGVAATSLRAKGMLCRGTETIFNLRRSPAQRPSAGQAAPRRSPWSPRVSGLPARPETHLTGKGAATSRLQRSEPRSDARHAQEQRGSRLPTADTPAAAAEPRGSALQARGTRAGPWGSRARAAPALPPPNPRPHSPWLSQPRPSL